MTQAGQELESTSSKSRSSSIEQEFELFLKSGDNKKIASAAAYLEKNGTLTHLRMLMETIKKTKEKLLKKRLAAASAHIIKRNLLCHYSGIPLKMRRQLVDILKKLDPRVLDSIGGDLNSKEEDIRFNAIRILSLMGKNPYLKVLIGRLLKDANKMVRATAVSLLKNIPEKANMPVLSALLNDKDDRVVANCIEVIESMGENRLAHLLAKFKTHPNNRIRANAIKALWTLGHDREDIYQHLKKMLEIKENFLMRASACWVIGECAQETDFKLLELLHNYAKDSAKLTRENVIKAQFKIGGAAVEIYQKELSNPKEIEEVRKSMQN